jgi:hypothetical protein
MFAPVALMLGFSLVCVASYALVIEVEKPILQDKGVVTIKPGDNQLGPYQNVIIQEDLDSRILTSGGSVWYSIPLNTVYQAHLYNLFPIVIDVPDNYGAFDLPSVLLADVGNGIGPLPDGFLLSEILEVNGNFFNAVITPISDLANLPTSTARNTRIQWDISGVSQSTGTFFLATTTLPARVPERSSAATN